MKLLDRQGSRSGRREEAQRKRGVTMVTVAVALVALIAAGTLAIDAGLLWSARTQLQNVADGSALAAALNMIDKTGPSVTIPAAEAAAVDVASKNSTAANASVAIDPADMSFGNWDLDARTLDTSVDLTIPENVTGVRVVAHLNDTINRPVPAFLSRVLGRKSFPVTAEATAYLGFAGFVLPGYVDLPIAIDCCKIAGPECEDDYCDTITTNPPNFGDYAVGASGNASPCYLEDGVTPVSCIDLYSSSGNQIACWTDFETDASVNPPGLIDIVEDGNPIEIEVGQVGRVDNGTKTPVVEQIHDKFYGEGSWTGDPAGQDLDGDGTNEWVVGLPVVECQTEMGCSSRYNAEYVGFVCFAIKEVIVTPDKRIKGYFLCESDPMMEHCNFGTTGSGGNDFGIRADIPVLVR